MRTLWLTPFITLLIFFLIISTHLFIEPINGQHLPDINDLAQEHMSSEEIVIIPDTDPYFGIIGASIACTYDSAENNKLIPLLIQHNQTLTPAQTRFIESNVTSKNPAILVLGESLTLPPHSQKTEILGLPPQVSIEIAKHRFNQTPTVLILPYGQTKYTLALIASPLANYLNMPILLFDNNSEPLQTICNDLNVTTAYIIGNIQPQLSPYINQIQLKTEQDVQQEILKTIKQKFDGINYITLTNPLDTKKPSILQTTKKITNHSIKNVKLIGLGKTIILQGEDIKQTSLMVPSGINHIQIYGNITCSQSPMDPFDEITPILSMTLYDPNGEIAAYAFSPGYDFRKTFLETLTCYAPGEYHLIFSVYHGIKGGFFLQRGISLVDCDIEITTIISTLENPHMPSIPHLSMLAPYLSTAHGGIIIANENFSLTSEGYESNATGLSAGPWYRETLHPFTNMKVNYTVNYIKETLTLLDEQNLLDDYLNGPAWLAILADTTMIPMYYFKPSQPNIPEKGLPSDNPYSLNETLSTGRLISYNVQDASLLICKTLFYKQICGKPESSTDWHHTFTFVFGEGYGETGGIFHQIPYSKEIKKYGFNSKVYGDLRNGRQIAELLGIYTNANYIEYLGHGDWFWFTPSIYGLDSYSKTLDVAHLKNWIFEKPSVFLTAACLMGRTDGIPPTMNIGLTLLHAGCNCFIGATRETGQEAGLTIIENHLIINDFSVGEALRAEKRIDKEPPTYYVRTLYGDPAFNPYEPNNGFTDQGRPTT